MRFIIVLALFIVLFLGVVYGALCATGNEKADIEGKIIGICASEPPGGNITTDSILVDGLIAGNSKNQNISVRITKETKVMQKNGDNYLQLSFNDLKPGQKIMIRLKGAIIQSYPVQVTADEIILLP